VCPYQLSAHADFSVWALFFFCPSFDVRCLSVFADAVHWMHKEGCIMSYYPTPGAPYVPQQPVNPYGGMGTVGLATPLPSTQMQQAQPQRPQPMNGQQPVQQSAQDGGWLLGRPVSSREEFLAIPSDLYGRPTYCPDLRSGVIYCKRLNPDTCESYVQEFYSPEAWRQMQAQQAQQTAAPTQQYVPIEQYNTLVHRLDELEKWQKSFSKPTATAKKGE
jgi:hypothetical protein